MQCIIVFTNLSQLPKTIDALNMFDSRVGVRISNYVSYEQFRADIKSEKIKIRPPGQKMVHLTALGESQVQITFDYAGE